MDHDTCMTILGGLISGLVGVVLFFLQRWIAGQDEQQLLLFRIYQLIVIPARAGAGENTWTIASHQNMADDAQKEEVGTLALRLKDLELATEVFLVPWKNSAERNMLAAKIRARLSPELEKHIKKGQA